VERSPIIRQGGERSYALPPTLTFVLVAKDGHTMTVQGHATREDAQPNAAGSTFTTAYDVVAPSVTAATYVHVQTPSNTTMSFGTPWTQAAPQAPLEYLSEGPLLYLQPGPPAGETPEVPYAGLLPVALAAGAGGYVWWRRRKARQ
ncbi:MAG: hypothetical protein OWT27_02230, partial [Firmicutes bacterium]|nr:hypothetical protein [Bacillota bacterium]